MPQEALSRRRVAGALAALSLCACWAALAGTCAAPARAASSATVGASFSPSRLGAKAAGTISMRFSGPGGVPAPLSGAVLRLPAGLAVNLNGVGICRPSSLRKRGKQGCSVGSLLGVGHATLKIHAGSQTLPESAAISVFRGPSRGSQPSFEILGEAMTPLYEHIVSTAVLQGDSAPFGSKLVVSVPSIPTLTYEPDASFTALSLTIGNAGTHSQGVITLPSRCPKDGFPLAASFSFADGSGTSASTDVPCPH
jgi:hypothetical protein